MKRAPGDLALFGGRPLFERPLVVGRPNIGNRAEFLRRVNDILDSHRLSNHGPYEVELEQRVAELAGVKHCIAVCNATVGIDILARAAGLGGEVIVPSFTFVATVHALRWQGLTPVFCDIDPETANIDPVEVEKLITPATSAVMGVHVWGRPCDADALERVTRRHGIRLLFDAAHALGCSYGGKSVGGFGDAEVFSFHATKFVNSFEGGAIVTNDDGIAEQARLVRSFGLAGRESAVLLGTNGKMSEVSAAMGITSLEAMDEILAVNRRNWRLYRELLSGIPGIMTVEYDVRERCNYQYVPVFVDAEALGVSRDAVFSLLAAENVHARKYFSPGCHRMEPYVSEGWGDRHLPHTDRLADSVLCLPTGSAVDESAIAGVCGLIHFLAEHAAEVSARGVSSGALK